MTAAYIDPLVGAALVHLGLPILPGLPCPTCGGRGSVAYRYPDGTYPDGLYLDPCPDCTDGVWTPPDHPVPIGVTSEYLRNSTRYGPWIVRQPVTSLRMDGVTEPWTMFDPRVNGSSINIVLSSMIGEGTLRPLKVRASNPHANETRGTDEVVIEGRRLTLWLDGDPVDISSALPFLPGLKPDDTVYLPDGFTESVVCPNDCARFDGNVPGHTRGSAWDWVPCGICNGTQRVSCPFPVVDAPDHPCVVVTS